MVEQKHIILLFDGDCGRQGEIWIERTQCCKCGIEHDVLCVDASEGEYSAGRICFDCICVAFGKRPEN